MINSLSRSYKLSLPNIGEFELFFNQVAGLITHGTQGQLYSQGADKCEFFPLIEKIRNP